MRTHDNEKRILEILKDLTPNRLDELLDFAEYLRAKEHKQTKPAKKERVKLPTFHLGNIESRAFDREDLYGEYLERKLD